MNEKTMETSDFSALLDEGAGGASSGIFVDEEGNWYYRGDKIIREDIMEFFLENVVIEGNGAFRIEWRGSACSIQTADTPFVVSRVDRVKSSEAEGPGEILLTFRHISRSERLDPASLRVGEANVLYCRIRDGRFPARFSRPAYYQLAEWIEEDSRTGGFCLNLGGKRYEIAIR